MAQLITSDRKKSIIQSFLVGSFSGICSTILFQPFDLIKTRLQSPQYKSNFKLTAVVRQVIKQDNVTGLWKGLTPSLLRCVPGIGIYFAALNGLSNLCIEANGKETAFQSVTLGTISRSISVGFVLPLTVIKTRLESGHYQYSSVLQAVHSIFKIEGIRGLYCGLSATVIRDAPYSGLYLMFYTQGKKRLPANWISEGNSVLSSASYFGCGVISGILASVITHPADVVKTRMQLFPAEFDRFTTALLHIYKVNGLTGYFRGLLPRLIRRTLVTAMTWTIYEEIMKKIGVK
ncbi:hypothetical protein CHUAL_007123 [Chamberlinius hualienensis]